MREHKQRQLRQFWAAVRHAQRLSDRIRERMLVGPTAVDEKEEGIAVVAIPERALTATRHLIRRTAR